MKEDSKISRIQNSNNNKSTLLKLSFLYKDILSNKERESDENDNNYHNNKSSMNTSFSFLGHEKNKSILSFSSENTSLRKVWIDEILKKNSNNNNMNNNSNNNNYSSLHDVSQDVLQNKKKKLSPQEILDKIHSLKFKILKKAGLSIHKLTKYERNIYTLFLFMNPKDEIYNLYFTSSLFNKFFKNYLAKNSNQFIIQNFQRVFSDSFQIIHKKITIEANRKNKNLFANLILQIKIKNFDRYISNQTPTNNKTSNYFLILLENSFSYKNKLTDSNNQSTNQDKQTYKNFYKFSFYNSNTHTYNNIHNSKDSNIFWITKEETSFTYNNIAMPYIMPNLLFYKGDFILISINLFNTLGFIDFEKFKWENLTVYEDINFTKRQTELNTEIETIVTKWNNFVPQNLPYSCQVEIQNFIYSFQEFFLVQEIKVCCIGFYIFRFKFKSIKTGINTNRTNRNICILVKDKEDPICNEVKKNELYYDNSRHHLLQVRMGDIVYIYLTLTQPQDILRKGA